MDITQDYQQLLNSAAAAERNGDLAAAGRLYDEALALRPSYEAWLANAAIAKKTGDAPKLGRCLEAAYKLQPSANLLFSLVIAMMDAGDLDKSEAYAKEGVTKRPNDFALANGYGVILKRLGRYEEAIGYFKKANKLLPKNISPYINLGNTYIKIGQPHKAAEHFLKATKMQPRDGENQRLLATAYIAMGEYDKALATLRQALMFDPKNAKTWMDIGRTHYNMHNYEQALTEAGKAAAAFPGDPDLLRLQAASMRKLGRVAEALKIYEGLLQKNDRDAETLTAVANLYFRDLNNLEQANKYYALSYGLDPDSTETASQYCESLLKSRYGDESEHIAKGYEVAGAFARKGEVPLGAFEAVQNAFLRTADFDALAALGDQRQYQKYLRYLTKTGQLHNQMGRVATMEDRLELVRCHREWGKKIEARADGEPIGPVPTIRRRNGKTRIAFMSSDLRMHPVTYFVQPILELYDRSRYELYCYSFYNGKPDPVQEKIAAIVDKFSVNHNLPDREIARLIAADEPDILFELGGTTYLNKVEVMAYRPAPVQVSWLGYPHSIGFSRIDYILVDPYINPEVPGLLVEKPFVMPETWVCLGSLGFNEMPIEPKLPEERRGYLTFGTMNNPYKYTAEVFAAWARVMKRVEGSRFLFVRPEGAVKYFRDNVVRKFASEGIAPERIEFVPVRGQHRPYYNLIDIALDPFPHTGGTTTCEALWMGVPTVTLAGQAFFERLSYSNLNNAGLGDLCAFSVAEYEKIAVALAQDRGRREEIRGGIRERIRNHPLGQTERFVRNFEAKIDEVLA